MKKMMSAFLALAMLLSLSAFAGDKGGNGGNGVYIHGQFYFFDLVEHGVEKNPYFDPSVTVNAEIKDRLLNTLPSEFPIELIAKKLSELEKIDPIFSNVIMRAMELYDWVLIESELKTIDDTETILNIELNQIAVRTNEKIYIDRYLWRKLDKANRTALIFHEAIYALILPKEDRQTGSLDQSSSSARAITGFIFTENYNKKDLAHLFELTRGKITFSRLDDGMNDSPIKRVLESVTRETDSIIGKGAPGLVGIQGNSVSFNHRITVHAPVEGDENFYLYDDSKTISKKIDRICERLVKTRARRVTSAVTVSFVRVQKREYKDGNVKKNYVAVDLFVQTMVDAINTPTNSKESCVSHLETRIPNALGILRKNFNVK